jgi:hypothetical protein
MGGVIDAMRRTSWIVALACGCSHDVRDGATDTSFEAETGAASVETSAADSGVSSPTTDTATTDSAADEMSSTTDPPIFDVGSPDAGVDAHGCQGVDLLFVVDNSGSMGAYQANLGASVPGFIAALRDALPTDDYHVMIVDSSGTPAGACDDRVGTGNRGNGSGLECLPAMGPNYLAGDDEIDELFPCLSYVGTGGDSAEKVADAMLNSVSPGFVGDGGCNAGFLREDSLLVVVVITDEFAGWGGAAWFNTLSSFKQEDGIILLGLIGDNPADGDPNDYPAMAEMTPWGTVPLCAPWEYFSWPNEASPNPGLVDLAQSFGDRGFLGSICAEDYSEFLLSAVETIALTCEEFEPAG